MDKVGAQDGLVEVSTVLPAYNEADKLEIAVARVAKALEEFSDSYEIIIAEDGSTDGTDKVAALLSRKSPLVKHLHEERRLGRGAALRNAFKKSSGRILVYMDVDLATGIGQLESLLRAIEEEGFDFAIGSRLLSESKVERSYARQVASRSYSALVRAVLGTRVKDYQCGFKAFKRESLMKLLDEVTARHWFWDTELIVRAFNKGYKIKEIPVVWKGRRETKVRLLKDSFDMAEQVMKLWWKLRRQ